MEELSPAVSVTFSLTNPISESSALGSHSDFARIKLLTETANFLSDPAPILNVNMGSFLEVNRTNVVVDNDVMAQETDVDEVMSVGDEPIEIGGELLGMDASLVSLPVVEGSDDNQVVAHVKETTENANKLFAMELVEKSHQGKGARSVFELEYVPLWGSHLVCGKRPEMEDALMVVPQFTKVPIKMFARSHVIDGVCANLSDLTTHFFGVYDGHGGSQVANYCRDRLHVALEEELKVAKQELAKGTVNDSVQDQWEKVFTNCFKKVDDEVSGKASRSVPDVTGKLFNITSEPVAPETVGSTAVVALISSSHIIVSNCGDSRAVLYRGKEAMVLSNDHKPNREDEYARIEAAGGKVIQWNGHRVFGVLAMSRSIGDRYLKPWIIPEPEVTFTARAREDECLILASDGLWDVMSNQEICEVARKRILIWHKKNGPNQIVRTAGVDPAAQAAANYLTMMALQKGSKDNISVIVVDLKVQRKFKTKS